MSRCLVILMFLFTLNLPAEEYLEVYNEGVFYRFVPGNSEADHFVQHNFFGWEQETFRVFNQVKNKEAIAIDLGAWIGVTSIWLSRHFHHVIAIEADRVSVQCLQNNLRASECPNVSICPQPIASHSRAVIFGPRGEKLNESISCIKQETTHPENASIRGITIKQLAHDYIFQNAAIANRAIAFIKCDIEGGEEDILEDLLHFAYYNKAKVYLSFHLGWWKSKKITDFKHLFQFFNSNCPDPDLCDYLNRNPFASILFEPKNSSEVLLKTEMPVVIIAYNQPTFVRNMVRQLEPYTSDITIIDNHSTFPPMLEYYQNEYRYTLLRQKENFGPAVARKGWLNRLVGEMFLLTDPDLQLNDNLPNNFIQTLVEVSNHFQAYKVGFALDIHHPNLREDALYRGYTIQMWEANAWKYPVIYQPDPHLTIYRAAIDTTFCLVNEKNYKPVYKEGDSDTYRVAGSFTCQHLPWLKDFHLTLEPGEYENYLKSSISTCWFGDWKRLRLRRNWR